MNITSLILSPDFQIYVTQQGHMVPSCIMYMYISYNEYFMAVEVLAKKGIIYARYYSYITSVIYNTLTSVTKTNHYMTSMIGVLICLLGIYLYKE